MAIRVQYGDVAGYAGLGVLAGKATAAREAVQRQAAMDRQVMQIQAQRASQERAQAHQREMAEFDAYLDNIRYQSAEAWEVEKMELRSRHDFDMIEARREADFQSQLQREQRQQQERDVKLKAIDETDWLSTEEKKAAKFKVMTGISLPKVGADDWRQQLMGEIMPVRTGQPIGPSPAERRVTGEAPALDPRVQEARKRAAGEAGARVRQTALQADTERKSKELRTLLPDLDSSTNAELKSILERGNPVEIDKAYRILGARIERPEKLRYQKFAFGG